MDPVQQIYKYLHDLKIKLQCLARFWHKKIINFPITPRRNLLIDMKEEKAAENKSSEVGKNMFLGQRGMVELSRGQNREQLGNTCRTTTKEDFSIKLLFMTRH
jgi:phage-related protein